MEKEIWKDIKGFEGIYQVSNLGRVKSLNYNRTKKEKILKPILKKTGYICYGLSNIKTKQKLAHSLVLNTFNPINKKNLQINHINGIKTDNRLENLEWCTCKENIQHAFRIGLKHGRRDEKNILSKKVGQYDINNKLIKVWNSTMEIQRELGYNNCSISQCCLGKIKKSHNFIWRYI